MPFTFPRLGRLFSARPPTEAHSLPRAARGEDAEVEAARTRARRRLVGALVLLLVGLVAFPLLFETEPRPQNDAPARRDSGVVTAERPGATASADLLALPGAAPAAASAAPASDPSAAAALASTASPAASAPPPEPVAAAVAEPVTATAPSAAGASVARPVPVPATAPPPATTPPAAPATAATPPRAASAVAAGRYVVQVGAYSNAEALRAVRQRVERLGLKTYTQVVETPAGPRTRLRVGPFEQRAQAEAAAGKLRGAGLPGVLLTL